jgi:hypothetical protein
MSDTDTITWQVLQQHAIDYFLSFLVFITHFVLVATILAAIWCIVGLVATRQSLIEKTLALLAVSSAALAYFLAKALGISVPELILASISDTPSHISLAFVAFIIPGLTGAITAFLMNQPALKSSRVYERVLVFLITLLVLMFTDVYVAAVQVAHHFDKQLAPNGSFVLGMSLYWILRGNLRS